jgi:hypothetical protein
MNVRLTHGHKDIYPDAMIFWGETHRDVVLGPHDEHEMDRDGPDVMFWW